MSRPSHDFPTDPNELAVHLLEQSFRKSLGKFLGLFKKDFAAKIDWKKGYELLDAELPHYLPEAQLKQRNAFSLFVKATLKTSKPYRFILHTIWMGDAKFALGISEVPDDVVKGRHVPLNWN